MSIKTRKHLPNSHSKHHNLYIPSLPSKYRLSNISILSARATSTNTNFHSHHASLRSAPRPCEHRLHHWLFGLPTPIPRYRCKLQRRHHRSRPILLGKAQHDQLVRPVGNKCRCRTHGSHRESPQSFGSTIIIRFNNYCSMPSQ